MPDLSLIFPQFIAFKIFSLLPNSIPDERTVSVFTRINGKDKSRQEASTVVAQTKIRQHYRREASEQAGQVCTLLLFVAHALMCGRLGITSHHR
jgi:hypothetical protein